MSCVPAAPARSMTMCRKRGQRQRVAIAHALLADAPLLLLDDALSAVDTDTEARILAHLRAARLGRTVIIVTHRLSAVADADETIVLRDGHAVEQGVRDANRIVVLNHGRIAELGNHGELMAIANGLYQRLYLLQQLQAVEELQASQSAGEN